MDNSIFDIQSVLALTLCLTQNYDFVCANVALILRMDGIQTHSYLPSQAGLAHAHWYLKSCSRLQRKQSQLCFQAPITHLLYLLAKSFNGSVLLKHLRLEAMKNFKGI